MNWQLQDAKQRFSELVRTAQSSGPQYVTRHNDIVAVVLSIEEYRRLIGQEMDLRDFLLSSSGIGEIELPPREIDTHRDIEFE